MYANMEHYLSGEQIRDDAIAAIETTGSIANVVEDLSPQLGGNLDTNGFVISNISGGTI